MATPSVVETEVYGPGSTVHIAGVLNAGEAPPVGTPAGTIFLIRPN